MTANIITDTSIIGLSIANVAFRTIMNELGCSTIN